MRKETDQLAARQLLQEGHEYVSILYVLEKVFHLHGRLTLGNRKKEGGGAESELLGCLGFN